MNPEENPPVQSFDEYSSFTAGPPQDSSTSFRSRGRYQGHYPRTRGPHHSSGDFQQRGRYSYNKRGGGHRPYYKNKNLDQHEQSETNDQSQATNIPNRQFNNFVRPTMWQDPWANMTPRKVPMNGTTLVFDPSVTH